MYRERDRTARQHALSQAAKQGSLVSFRDAATEVRRSGASLLRAEVTQVLPDGKVRIRRETSVNPDGSLGVEDPFDYPIAAGAEPSVGDWIFGMESGGKPIFFGGPGAASGDAPDLLIARQDTDQAIQPSLWTAVKWNSSEVDTAGYLQNDGRIVLPSAGRYVVLLSRMRWAENYSGLRRVRLKLNNDDVGWAVGNPGHDGISWMGVSTAISAQPGDEISAEVFQNTTGPQALDSTKMEVIQVSGGPKGAKGDPGGPGGPGEKGDRGPVGINWRNDANGALWSNAVNYLKDDGVRHAGSSWRALRPNVGVQPVEGLDWTYVAQKGDKGDKGNPGGSDGNVATIQLRRATASSWTANNPILSVAEEGHETDTGKRKVGDGTKAWSNLPYFGGADAAKVILQATVDKLIPHGGYVPMDFDVVKKDTSGFYNPANKSRVVIPPGLGGDYLIAFSVGIANRDTNNVIRTNGLRRGRIGIDSGALPQNDDRWDQPSAFSICLFTTVANLPAGTEVRAEGYQNSGSTLTLQSNYCGLSLVRLA